eukprot:14711148-Alexandrium_andersonii.AAC.1
MGRRHAEVAWTPRPKRSRVSGCIRPLLLRATGAIIGSQEARQLPGSPVRPKARPSWPGAPRKPT